MGESKGYNYKKLDNGGQALDQVPKFLTDIAEQKKKQLGDFDYNKPEYEDKTS